MAAAAKPTPPPIAVPKAVAFPLEPLPIAEPIKPPSAPVPAPTPVEIAVDLALSPLVEPFNTTSPEESVI